MYGFYASQYLWRLKMFSSIQVTLGSANTMILVELRSRLWLIDNRIVGGADGLCAGLDRQLGGYLGLGWAHRVIGGLPHLRLRGVDSPSHWLQSLGAKGQSVDHLRQYLRPGHYFVTVHFWNSDIQYTTIFVRQILRILLNQDPALLLQLKVSLYRHSSLYFCDQTVISSILSIDYIYIYFPVLQWKTTFHQFKERNTGKQKDAFIQ